MLKCCKIVAMSLCFILLANFAQANAIAIHPEDVAKVNQGLFEIHSSQQRQKYYEELERISSEQQGKTYIEKLKNANTADALSILGMMKSEAIVINSILQHSNKGLAFSYLSNFLEYKDLDHPVPLPLEEIQTIISSIKNSLLSEKNTYVKKLALSVIGYLEAHVKQGSYQNPTNIALTLPSNKGMEVVIVGAVWCGSCLKLKKEIKEKNIQSFIFNIGSREYSLPIYHLDIEQDTEYLAQLDNNINTVPAIFLLTDGQPTRIKTDNQVVAIVESLKQSILSNKEKTQVMDLATSLKKRKNTKFQAILIGTGLDASENPLFSYESIKRARDIFLDKYNTPLKSIITLFGSGWWTTVPDYHSSTDDKINLHKAKDLYPDSTFTLANMNSIAKVGLESGVKNNLFVISGHGFPGGIATAAESKSLSPAFLKDMHAKSQAKNIVISGTCYGGQFALSTTCGFYAARPDLTASGCWSEKPTDVRDYTNLFFNNIMKADSKNITFEEAHFKTFSNKDPHDTPYTSIDALADNYFKANSLPLFISFNELFSLREYGSISEKNAFDILFKKELANSEATIYLKRAANNNFTLANGFQVYLSWNPENNKIKLFPSPEGMNFLFKETYSKNLLTITEFSYYEQEKKFLAHTIGEGSNGELEKKIFMLDIMLSEDSKKIFGQQVSQVQMIKRLLFKKAVRENKVNDYMLKMYNGFVACESQKIQDFTRGL